MISYSDIQNALKLYDEQSFLAKGLFGNQYIENLRKVYSSLPKPISHNDRPLTATELYKVFDSILKAKPEPGSTVEKIFNNLIKAFNPQYNNLIKINEQIPLREKTFIDIFSHPNPNEFIDALLYFLKGSGYNTGFSIQDYQQLKNNVHPMQIVSPLVGFANFIGELRFTPTEDQRNQLRLHENPRWVITSLQVVKPELITQQNLEPLITYHQYLGNSDLQSSIFWSIPPHLLNQATLDEIYRRCAQANGNIPAGIQAIMQYLNPLLQRAQPQPPAAVQDLNDSQSTHTASVHATVSESASRLRDQYMSGIDQNRQETILQDMHKWILSLPNNLVCNAAKNAMVRLTSPHQFVDAGSRITTKNLLVLFWISIHDDQKRISSLEEGKKRLIEALYEAQREYNLDAKGIDKGGEDKPACAAGTFNKLVEKLQGVHPSVQIKFITKKTAAMKLPIVVKEELTDFLNSKKKSAANFSQFRDFLEKLKEDGLESVWPEINKTIRKRMEDEFKTAFLSEAEFGTFIENGIYTDISQVLEKFTTEDKSTEASNTLGFFAQTEQPNPDGAPKPDGTNDGLERKPKTS